MCADILIWLVFYHVAMTDRYCVFEDSFLLWQNQLVHRFGLGPRYFLISCRLESANSFIAHWSFPGLSTSIRFPFSSERRAHHVLNTSVHRLHCATQKTDAHTCSSTAAAVLEYFIFTHLKWWIQSGVCSKNLPRSAFVYVVMLHIDLI